MQYAPFYRLTYNLSDIDGWCNPKVISMTVVCEPLVMDDLESDIGYYISPCC